MTMNHIGKTVYVSAALPATNDAAGFEALTWTKAAGVQQAPQFGITHDMIDVGDLELGFTQGIKGAGQGVDTSGTWRKVDGDAGQAIIETQANNEDGLMSMKIVRGTGTGNAPVAGDPVEYAQGIAHSYVDNQPTDSTHEGFTIGFRQNALTVKATEPA